MDTLDVQQHPKKTHPSLKNNVYAANRLPMYTHVPMYIINNSDADDRPGSHWITLYIDTNGIGQYFDSYGRSPARYHLEFLERNCKEWDWKVDRIQNEWNSFCGLPEMFSLNVAHVIVPSGFYKLLTKIKNDYNNPPVIITENGFATKRGLDDDDRVTYMTLYINAILDAIDDGSDIRSYTVWSMMDSFEWLEGFSQRYGLYEVDFESPERTRTPRKSAFVYKQFVRTRELDWHYELDTDVMTIDEGH